MSDDNEAQLDDNSNIKHLRERAKQAAEAEKQLEELQARLAEVEQSAQQNQRNAAFLKAGLDPEDPKVKYFYQGYDGELDPDAIRTEAQTIGLSQVSRSQTPDPGANIDVAMNTGQAPPRSEIASDHVPPDGELAHELGGGFTNPDTRDITNQPRLVPIRNLS